MNLYAILEPLVVGAIVLASLIVVVRKQAPGLWRKLTRSTKPVSSCGGCDGCSDNAATDKPKPIRIYRKHPTS